MRALRRLVLLLSWWVPLVASAQESPSVPFDSAGTELTLTGDRVVQLGLRPPAWPVTGSFTTARLVTAPGDLFVLLVTRESGEVERYVLDAEQKLALVREVTRRLAALAAIAPPPPATPAATAPDILVPGAPSRTSAARTRSTTDASALFVPQVVLAAVATGPAIAVIADDRNISPALYLATVGATYLIARNAVGTDEVDRLAAGGANIGTTYGALLGSGLGFAVGGTGTSAAFGIVGGAALGATAGWLTGGTASPAGVRALVVGPMIGGALGAAAVGAAGGSSDSTPGRQLVGVASAAAVVAAPLTKWWVDSHAGRLTEGDVDLLVPVGVTGALVGVWLASLGSPTTTANRVLAGGGIGFALGAVVAAQGISLRSDVTQSQVRAYLGAALAGGYLGAAVYSDRSETASLGGMAVAASAALLAVHSAIKRAPDGSRIARVEGLGRAPGDRGPMRWSLDPSGAVFAALRTPGVFPVLRATF